MPLQTVYDGENHVLECERLQTVPDNYTNHVSNTQRYRMFAMVGLLMLSVTWLAGMKNSTVRG